MASSGSRFSIKSVFWISLIVLTLVVASVSGVYAQKAKAKTKPKPAMPTPKIGDVKSNSIGMEFVWIPPGEFMMGSSEYQIDQALSDCNRVASSPCERWEFEDETPQRRVTLLNGFLMGRYEVTQGQWQLVMESTPSFFEDCGLDCPVEQISWNDAKEFISRLNAKNDGFVYSLPTEAQWEYAARAGTTTAFAFGDSLSSAQANFDGNYPFGGAPKGPSLEMTAKVGSYKPNAWGLYDMHGNVWELVEDWYTDSYTGLPTDGSANLKKGNWDYKVLRGGALYHDGGNLRSADRNWVTPTWSDRGIGFRVVARPAN